MPLLEFDDIEDNNLQGPPKSHIDGRRILAEQIPD
jgi:hypothetical protein